MDDKKDVPAAGRGVNMLKLLLQTAEERLKIIFRRSGTQESEIPYKIKALKTASSISAAAGFAAAMWVFELSLVSIALFSLLPPFFLIIMEAAKAKKRRDAVLAELPAFMDMLSLSLGAGLAFPQALAATAESLPPGPLREDIENILNAVKHGRDLAEALAKTAHRSGVAAFTAFSDAVCTAKELGADLSRTITSQAELQRSLAISRLEKHAQTAPVRMMIPMFMFIFPTIVLLIFAPLVIQYGADLF